MSNHYCAFAPLVEGGKDLAKAVLADSSPRGRGSAVAAGLLLPTAAALAFSLISGESFWFEAAHPIVLSPVMSGHWALHPARSCETPAFRRIVAETRVERVPVIELIKRQPR
jgi:hypothetical protein